MGFTGEAQSQGTGVRFDILTFESQTQNLNKAAMFTYVVTYLTKTA